MSITINNVMITPSSMFGSFPRAHSVGDASEDMINISGPVVKNQLRNLKEKIKQKNLQIKCLIKNEEKVG